MVAALSELKISKLNSNWLSRNPTIFITALITFKIRSMAAIAGTSYTSKGLSHKEVESKEEGREAIRNFYCIN